MPQVDNNHVRGAQTKIDDSGDQQLAYGDARKDEQYGGKKTGIPVHQWYGRNIYPPKGTQQMYFAPDGNNDKAMVLHGEHAPTRKSTAKGLTEGQIRDYDMWGHKMTMQSDGWHWIIGSSEVIFGHDGTVTFKCTKFIADAECHIGGTGGVLSKRCDDSCATKVYET